MKVLERIRSLPAKRKKKIQDMAFVYPIVFTALVLLYGVLRWPKAPIREVSGQYLDKAGTAYTEAVYHQFLVWQTGLFICFAVIVGLLLLVRWVFKVPLKTER